MNKDAELEMAERHVIESDRHVERQREIVAELREGGHHTAQAEELLATFERTLAGHRAHLDLIRSEIRENSN